jgi:hypothetical protein
MPVVGRPAEQVVRKNWSRLHPDCIHLLKGFKRQRKNLPGVKYNPEDAPGSLIAQLLVNVPDTAGWVARHNLRRNVGKLAEAFKQFEDSGKGK